MTRMEYTKTAPGSAKGLCAFANTHRVTVDDEVGASTFRSHLLSKRVTCD